MKRFSRISIRPTPLRFAIAFTARNRWTASVMVFFFPLSSYSNLLGIPLVNSKVKSSGLSGASVGSTVSFHISFGGVTSGSSRMPASYEA